MSPRKRLLLAGTVASLIIGMTIAVSGVTTPTAVAAAEANAANPCEVQNPCAANPCAANPCAANPCAPNPCEAANPCAANPCAPNPCEAANPCAVEKWAKRTGLDQFPERQAVIGL